MYALLLVVLLDGSSINLQIADATTFDVTTRYGLVKVPAKELLNASLGIHVDDDTLFKMHAHNLNSLSYKKRDAAMIFFRGERRASYRYILPLKNDKDAEVVRRVDLLIEEYRGVLPQLDDKITTTEGVFTGYLQQKEIQGTSDALGEVKIRMSKIRALSFRPALSKIGIEYKNGWVDVGYYTGKIKIEAKGTVDLYPEQPGSYSVTPAGSTVIAPHNSHPGGALIGRLNGGPQFLVGPYFQANIGQGRLELRINDSPWQNSVPTGTFEVEVDSY